MQSCDTEVPEKMLESKAADTVDEIALANRHGLITGATGIDKIVSLQVMAEVLARAGVPLLAAVIKEDFSAICEAAEARDSIVRRTRDIGLAESCAC